MQLKLIFQYYLKHKIDVGPNELPTHKLLTSSTCLSEASVVYVSRRRPQCVGPRVSATAGRLKAQWWARSMSVLEA